MSRGEHIIFWRPLLGGTFGAVPCKRSVRAISRKRVLESDGTRNRCKPAIIFAELLLSAKKGHLWWNGHIFVRKSPLQKSKLVRQLLQRDGSNLLNCMLLCLKSVF